MAEASDPKQYVVLRVIQGLRFRILSAVDNDTRDASPYAPNACKLFSIRKIRNQIFRSILI